MLKSLRGFMASIRTAQTPAKSNPCRFSPQVEAPHDRITPSVNVIGGHLIIHGTAFNDSVSVVTTSSSYKVTEDNNAYLSPTKVTYIPIARVTGDITFKGFDGNDSFTNWTARRTFAFGGDGNDVLIGGSGADELHGERGDDYLHGSSGQDALFGEDGNDRLFGGADLNANYLDGGRGNDVLTGGHGADVLLGGSGLDHLYGGAGDDRLDGGVGDGEQDVLVGGSGKDLFRYDRYVYDSMWFGTFELVRNNDYPSDFDPAQDVIYF